MEEGVDGLLRDKMRPSRIAPLSPDLVERMVALTLADPSVEVTHWAVAMMAALTGISESAVPARSVRHASSGWLLLCDAVN